MPSRRQFLAGAGVAGLGLASGGWAVHIGSIAAESPPTNAWPQTRRDAANTASTDAEIPSNPSVAWAEQAVGDGTYATLVADAETAYVGGAAIAAHDRESGTNRWRVDASGELLALHDETLYAAPSHGTDPGDGRRTLRAYDVSAGVERWHADLPSVAYGLTPTEDAVFVGCHGSLAAYGLDGSHRWTLRTSGNGIVRPMVFDGALYAATPGHVSRFESRRLLDVPVGGTPDPTWTGPDVYGGYPTVVGDTLVVGNDQSRMDVGDAGVSAFAVDSGEAAWAAIEGPSRDNPERVEALTPARVGGADQSSRIGVTGVSRSDGSASDDAVVGIDLGTGEVRWRRELDPIVTAVAGVADGAVVATEAGNAGGAGSIRGYSPAGEERWVVEFDEAVSVADRAVRDVAPVAGELLAVLGDGRLVSLR